jgi:S-DNA-T family DNA segregation ATPase FtsK/SpoIIIE
VRLALGSLFQRSEAQKSENSDRIARELKGSIFTLLGLFELVALTSYLPLDSFNLFLGRFDHMNNLGGIVGAGLGEGLLGSVGIMGYSVVILTVWLSFCAFKGVALKENTFAFIGTFITTCLAAIACHLILEDRVPEASLLQGGWVGKIAGEFMKHYFNTTGALLLVCGGFIFTLILTAGLSITRIVSNLIGTDEEAIEEEEPVVKKAVAKAAPVAVAAAPAAPPAKKRTRKKKDADPDAATATTPDGEPAAATTEGEVPAATFDPTVFRELIPFDGSYAPPSLRLLKPGGGGKRMSRGEARKTGAKLTELLLSFQITGEVTAVSQGPVLTTYEYKPTAGMKLSKIAGLEDDLGIVLGTNQLRIMAPIPGKTVVGIEVPRPSPEVIAFKDIVSEDEFTSKKIRLPVAVGKTTDGISVVADLAAMPHLLVAGGTGSGKSVFINSLIMSLIYRLGPQDLRMILVDPKMLELNAFEGLPHLITNVITDHGVAFNALNWAVEEMERRYRLMADAGSKNIDSFNEKKRSQKLPFIVIVVDELADIMLSGGEAVELAITRLAQKARAAGIHLVIATQRPSTNVVTGLIKANMPSRLSFKVPSAVDSRTVLDSSGAESLMGRGDSLMTMPGIPLRRLHGCFISEEELHRVVKSVKGTKDYSKYYIDFGGAKKD